MNETEIKFEREKREGTVPLGTYLLDAARRMGVEVECDRLGLTDSCAMIVTEGRDLLSEPTTAELELLDEERRNNGERLACQAKILTPGEIGVKTKEKQPKPEEPKPEEKTEQYRKEFEEMPLEKKVAALLQLEVIALGETFSFIVNSPFKIFEKAMDVMAEFGLKIDADTKKATRPKEHHAENGTENETVEEETVEAEEKSTENAAAKESI